MRDKYGRETIGSAAEFAREEGLSAQIQGDESNPDCVIILPAKKIEETEEHESDS